MINTAFQEVLLPANNGIADLYDRLLPLLDILDQLNGALVAFLDVVARIFVVAVFGQQALVGGIKPQRGKVFIVHDDQPFVTVFDEGNVRLNQSRLNFVVAQTGSRIESLDEIERRNHRLDRATQSFADFPVLLQLHSAQVRIDYSD